MSPINAQNRELLLETEPVDEVTAAGTRYRVVRADEFLYSNAEGPEQPRPTDPEPADRGWGIRTRDPEPDTGFVIQPHVVRMRRLVRMGPDGPETPRPSDEDPYADEDAPDDGRARSDHATELTRPTRIAPESILCGRFVCIAQVARIRYTEGRLARIPPPGPEPVM
ncbi:MULTISPECIES: DUF5954 family protein [unclassified Streptomyces]|uniref:DUF5954 family protein n=1 Tax=unclassified Streptomyces TaxID=2593676 RepID=UPI001BECBD2A|nr:hypothetical protein [Streptomyces sp. ISL-21]MBT2610944.1 hypothetical protein [Streptomyces sp. ISL-87]